MMNTKWDGRFLELADTISAWSKDPSRGVGAVIVSPMRQVIATGYNGLPRGVEDHPDRLARPAKYDSTRGIFTPSRNERNYSVCSQRHFPCWRNFILIV
ncbi:MAG TPA: hypothetical protein EYO40_08585 [Phycisphaerales bacterium]|nr:hypothetical protein [Phycisphaerales bacterium]